MVSFFTNCYRLKFQNSFFSSEFEKAIQFLDPSLREAKIAEVVSRKIKNIEETLEFKKINGLEEGNDDFVALKSNDQENINPCKKVKFAQ